MAMSLSRLAAASSRSGPALLNCSATLNAAAQRRAQGNPTGRRGSAAQITTGPGPRPISAGAGTWAAAAAPALPARRSLLAAVLVLLLFVPLALFQLQQRGLAAV